MPILNIKTESIGSSGQIPKMIYINTNDTVSGVQVTGYLNSAVSSQNFPLSETDLAMVVTRETPSSSDVTVGLYNVIFDSGNWSLEAFVGSAIAGAVNLGIGSEVYKETLSSVLQFKTLVAGNNVTITSHDDHVTIESVTGGFAPADDYVITGHFSFEGGFDVNSPDPVTISSGGQLLLQSTADVARLLGNSIDIIAITGNADLRSDNGNLNIFCNNGHINLSGSTGTLSTTNQLDISAGANIQVNTTNGNFNVFAGSGPTPGQINLGATDTININSQTDVININANDAAGSVNMSGGSVTNGSWAAGATGVGGGVSAGSGCSFDAVTGNVSFGASTGAFLLGAFANSVDILSGTVMTLTASTSLDLASADIVLSLITDQAPAIAVPAIALPVGFKYVVINSTTGQLYKMG